MKFWDGPYTITSKCRKELTKKIDRFRQECRIRYPVHLVMVTAYGVRQNEHSLIIHNEVTMKDMFESD